MKNLQVVGLDYLDASPNKMQMTANIKAPVEFVFTVFEDGDAWVNCFESITRVDWTSEPPHNKGATRTIDLKLPGQPVLTIDEEFVTWEQNKRFSFYFKRSNRKIFGAMIEDYKFAAAEDGSTNIVWDLAYEGTGIFRFIFKLISGSVQKDNQKALNAFKDYIEEKYQQHMV